METEEGREQRCTKKRTRDGEERARASETRGRTEHRHRAAGPGVDLVVHHVLQPLVVDGADENQVGERLSGAAVVQALVAMALEAEVGQHAHHAVRIHRSERCRIASPPWCSVTLPRTHSMS